jgi:hypothetical protein
MGFNFALVVDAVSDRVELILVLDYQLSSLEDLAWMAGVGVTLFMLIGYFIGLCLNRARGLELPLLKHQPADITASQSCTRMATLPRSPVIRAFTHREEVLHNQAR